VDRAKAVFNLLLFLATIFAFSLVGVYLAGVWYGLARQLFYIGAHWVTVHDTVRAAWPFV